MEATRCRTAPLARRQEDGRGSVEGRGCLGAAPGEAGRIDDGAVRGYFEEATSRTRDLSESLHDPRRDFLRAPSHGGGARVSRKNRVIAGRRSPGTYVRALRNLSNDRGKQRKDVDG